MSSRPLFDTSPPLSVRLINEILLVPSKCSSAERQRREFWDGSFNNVNEISSNDAVRLLLLLEIP